MAAPLSDARIFANAEKAAVAAAAQVVRHAQLAISDRGNFHLALAGGDTFGRCYRLLRHASIAWDKVHVYFGDERCLPAGHVERNDHMAREALLAHVAIPKMQIHCIPAELGPEAAASAYAELLAGAPPLDLVLLGLGEDGHTASLFPENPALEDMRLAVPVWHAPKPPPERVSMGYAALNAARARLIMATGSGKAEAVRRIRAGAPLPAAGLHHPDWFLDKAAAGDL